MKYSLIITICMLANVLFTRSVLAQSGSGSGGSGGSGSGGSGGSGSGAGGSGGSGGSGSGGLINPLESTSITDLLMKIVDIILVFAIPIIVFFIMYAGFMFVTAQGEEGKIRDARAALTWAVVGGVIVLGAKLILEVIQGTVNSL